MTTLDDYCPGLRIDKVFLIKIDVQGFEIEVLKGATRTLPRTDFVFVESGTKRRYDDAPSYDAPSFMEVCLSMDARGFPLMHMRAWCRGNRLLVEADMILRRDDFAPSIDRAGDRYYAELN